MEVVRAEGLHLELEQTVRRCLSLDRVFLPTAQKLVQPGLVPFLKRRLLQLIQLLRAVQFLQLRLQVHRRHHHLV